MKRCLFILALAVTSQLTAQVIPPAPKTKLPAVALGPDGRLVYNKDSSGNRVPNFSYCGYMAGDKTIPDVPAKVMVPITNGDATIRIQAALDYVASLPAYKDGIRGAVVLEKGVYEIAGSLVFNVSGIVLRGSGMEENGTVLLATGQSRETLIKIFNKDRKQANLLSQIGIENLRCRSTYDLNNPKDEAHRWMAITMEQVTDAWIRQVIFEHFAGSAVAVLETAQRITVEDCKSLAPVSEIGGQRRNTFYTTGKQVLFQRIYAEYGYHDFAVGYSPEGANAFVQCESVMPYSYSGTIEKTASNVLFDMVKVDGNALGFPYNSLIEAYAGPGVRNSVLWQCSAARVDCFEPAGGTNWAFGIWAEFAGNGSWFYSNEHVKPRSLYYAQLQDRLGSQSTARAQLLFKESVPTTSPTITLARQLTTEAYQPVITLSQWISQSSQRQPILTTTSGVKSIDEIGYKKPLVVHEIAPMLISNGWLVRNNSILTGKRHEINYWAGNTYPSGISVARPHITRYVPGRTGTGLTDDLPAVTDWMINKHIIAMDHNYGLWYDRRRDDHERFRRMDGNVLPPFYELPFARSGEGTGWDGLSKYDLTKYNPWYWDRLQQFARLADEKGLILIHENYHQHNIIEAGAHYVDFPWRTANNINHTPFPEPVPFAEDKRIFMAEQFYDISNADYRNLHKAYIRKCLDNFSSNTNVIQLISAEYTGPLHFVRFWLDVIKEWEKETGKKAKIGLSTTKDVQDSILADKDRADLIDLIDIRFWYYQADGKAYAPQGGLSLSPRQHARQMNPQPTSFEQVYRAVHEYRVRYPEKAVIFSTDEYDKFGWAVFMAGGSLAAIPILEDASFLKDAATMKPLEQTQPRGQYVMANAVSFIVYSDSSSAVRLDLSNYKGIFSLSWIDPLSGKVIKKGEKVRAGKIIDIDKPVAGNVVLWVRR